LNKFLDAYRHYSKKQNDTIVGGGDVLA
jgi:hypothetical protein